MRSHSPPTDGLAPDKPAADQPATGRPATESAQIGIFDSGVGGLTVAAALHRLLPAQPMRYVADSAWFPYGRRTEAAVRARALALGRRLAGEGCALLVVACNTASSAALEALREELDVPVVGMEPPIKPAVERSRSGRVVVLVTPATAGGARLARLERAHGGNAEVETVAMPGLAALVERGEIAGERIERRLRDALEGPLSRGADQVALGCTHYGFLRPALLRLVGEAVEVVDAAEPVARRARQQLEAHALPLAAAGEARAVLCSATGDGTAFAATLERLRAGGASLPPLRLAEGAAVPGGPAFARRSPLKD